MNVHSPLKPTFEEIFDNYEHLLTNPPLSNDDDEETNIQHV